VATFGNVRVEGDCADAQGKTAAFIGCTLESGQPGYGQGPSIGILADP
jgi:hypothetical protein